MSPGRAAAALGFVLLFAASAAFALRDGDVAITDPDLKALDPFEARSLSRADKAFEDGLWRQAVAEYDAFLQEFPRSAALAYAIMRKGRAMQYDNKRHDAIKIYNDVLDYFPDSVHYAAAALFYMGQCHEGNGNVEDALKCWKEMAEDADYRRHALAAHALNALAGRLLGDGKVADAAKYYLQVATDFREANRRASDEAIRQLLFIHVRVSPDVRRLRAACVQLNGFDWPPRKEKAEDDAYFWTVVRGKVREMGGFNQDEADKRTAYFRYWADAMEGKRPADDDFVKDNADFRRAADGKQDAWFARLDKQFEAYQKTEDYARVAKWIVFYREYPAKVNDYYAKLNFAKMSNDLIRKLMEDLFDVSTARAIARNLFFKLKFNEMKDPEKVSLARFFWHRDEELVVETCNRMDDKDLGHMEELRFWFEYRGDANKKAERGLPLADMCTVVTVYAREAYWIKAGLLRGIGKLEEAIQAYQMTDDPPRNLFAIAECLVGLGRVDPAVGQLQEIENFFEREAPEAGLRVAHVYRGAGRREQYVAGLRDVMKKYPRSGQSSAAHQELEALGIKIGGGIDAD